MTTTTREDIVRHARACIGTPYHHQARKPGIGLDCVGLVVCVGKTVAALPAGYDVTGYSRNPDGSTLMRHLQEQLHEIHRDQMAPGDVVCVAFDKHPQHIGICGDYVHGGLSIIHASNAAGKTIETRLLFSQSMRFVSAFRFKNLQEE